MDRNASWWSIGLGLLLCASSARAVQDCELNGEAVNPANGHTTEGKTGFMRCHDRDSGRLMREQEIKSGVFMGLVRFYDDEGHLMREHNTNARGNHDGLAREFSPGGVVVREATYRDGRTVGLVRTFYANGKLKRVTFVGDAERELAYAELNEDGRPAALRCDEAARLKPHVPDDQWCGHHGVPFTLVMYDSQGRKHDESTRLRGETLHVRRYFSNGRLSMERVHGTNERRESTFHEDGKPRTTALWKKTAGEYHIAVEETFGETGRIEERTEYCLAANAGKPLREHTYYQNGQPQGLRSYNYDDCDKPIVTVRGYLDDGTLYAHGRYRIRRSGGQIPIGVHRAFDPKGNVRNESHYDDEGRLTRVRIIDAEGNIEVDDLVFPDGSRKQHEMGEAR